MHSNTNIGFEQADSGRGLTHCMKCKCNAKAEVNFIHGQHCAFLKLKSLRSTRACLNADVLPGKWVSFASALCTSRLSQTHRSLFSDASPI